MTDQVLTVQGTVQNIYHNDNNSVLVVTNDRGTVRFSTRYKNSISQVSEGDSVEFQAKQNGKWWNITGKVDVTSKAPPLSVRVETGVDDRQRVIMFQHSQKVAARLLGVAVDTGAISVPTKKAERLQFLLDTTDELAREVFQYILSYMKGEEAVEIGIEGAEQEDLNADVPDTPVDPFAA